MTWAVFCDQAVIGDNGRLSALGIFDTLYARAFPAVRPFLCIVLKCAGGSDVDLQSELTVSLLDADGSHESQFEIASLGLSTGIHQIVEIEQLPLPAAGDYTLRIQVDGKLKWAMPLRVVQIEKHMAKNSARAKGVRESTADLSTWSGTSESPTQSGARVSENVIKAKAPMVVSDTNVNLNLDAGFLAASAVDKLFDEEE